MKKIISFIMMLILTFTLASCHEPQVNDPSNTPNVEEKPSTPDQGEKPVEKPGTPLVPIGPSEPIEQPDTNVYDVRKDYYYEFKSGDETQFGSTTTFNNLKWTSSFNTKTGFNALKGVQIGTSKNPENNFKMEADFGERVQVTSVNLELATNTRANHSYKVSIGKTVNTGSTDSADVKSYTLLDLNAKSNKLILELSADGSKGGVYIKSISISLLTTKDSKLEFAAPEVDKPVGPVIPGEGLIPARNYTLSPNIVEEYYKLFDLTLTGSALRQELATKNALKTKTSYGDSRYMLQYTDEMLDKPGYVYGIYDAKAIEATWQNGQTWNREHVWACNHMTRPTDKRPENPDINHMTDLHNLRASTNEVNSSRGDQYFSQLINDVDHYDPNTVAPAGGDFRGDVARILFYMYAQYDFLNLNDNPNADLHLSMGQLTELLEWHTADPVDAFEIQRNNRVYEYQGNRNPFIDKPILATQLFQ